MVFPQVLDQFDAGLPRFGVVFGVRMARLALGGLFGLAQDCVCNVFSQSMIKRRYDLE